VDHSVSLQRTTAPHTTAVVSICCDIRGISAGSPARRLTASLTFRDSHNDGEFKGLTELDSPRPLDQCNPKTWIHDPARFS
jgi:hypothetical protein